MTWQTRSTHSWKPKTMLSPRLSLLVEYLPSKYGYPADAKLFRGLGSRRTTETMAVPASGGRNAACFGVAARGLLWTLQSGRAACWPDPGLGGSTLDRMQRALGRCFHSNNNREPIDRRWGKSKIPRSRY